MERRSRTLELPVVKAWGLLPPVQHARKLGLRIAPLLRHANLPANFGEDPAAIVPLVHWHALYDRLVRETGIADLGWEVGINNPLSAFGREFTQGIASAPTLYQAFRFISHFGARHCSNHHLSVRLRGDYGYVMHSVGGDHSPGAGQRSIERAASAVLVIREFLGNDWQPDVIAVNAAQSEIPSNESLGGIRMLCRRGHDLVVRLPRAALAARCRSRITSNADYGDPIPTDFLGRLKLVLAPYEIDVCPKIAEISEMLGTSPRSLQRRLTEAGTCYTEVVQQVRYNLAAEMLRDSNMRVIDVANTLGYEDASHFSRFFRNIAGIAPRDFRSLHRAQVSSSTRRPGRSRRALPSNSQADLFAAS